MLFNEINMLCKSDKHFIIIIDEINSLINYKSFVTLDLDYT